MVFYPMPSQTSLYFLSISEILLFYFLSSSLSISTSISVKAGKKCSHLLLCMFSMLVQLSDLLNQTLFGILMGVQRLFKLSLQVLQLRLEDDCYVLGHTGTQNIRLSDI